MNFKDPLYLALIPVLLLLLFFKLRQKRPALRYSLAAYIRSAVSENKYRKYMFLVLRTCILLILIVALARPQKGLKERSVIKPGIDIMLVMDVSTSMLAIDFDPLNRIQAAVDAAEEFVAARTSDRLGVVVFAGLPLLQCPLTLDNSAVSRLMDSIDAGMIKIDGTAIGLGISLGLKYLERSDSPSKVMVLLTDGANNTGDIDPDTAADMAASLGIKIYAIGCGKPGPARVPVDHPYFGRRYITIDDELDEAALRRIADRTGGAYFRATSAKKLSEIYSEIDKLEQKTEEVTEYYEFEEKYPLLLIIAGILIAAEIAGRFLFSGAVI
ncbi:MAG: VWA domain-containing protein [Elusimicrobia bacterium]|nr:VWA domain-containing protein [Elusimicrobiota bacterium]